MDLAQHRAVVAQVSNLLYRRFPIGRPPDPLLLVTMRGVRRLEALRYSRLETCATTLSTPPVFAIFPFSLHERGERDLLFSLRENFYEKAECRIDRLWLHGPGAFQCVRQGQSFLRPRTSSCSQG